MAKSKMSECKEIFLALCLIAREIPQTVIKKLKEQYGEGIRKTVIYKLKKSGYITKVGYRTNYGYTLTNSGYEYIRKHFGEKYNCSSYKSYNKKLSYDEQRRYRNQRLCELLYYFLRHGVSIENHAEEFRDIITNKNCSQKTYFITSREVRLIHPRFSLVKGGKFYGLLVTPQNIHIVYATDTEHQLHLNVELLMKDVIELLFKGSFYEGKIYPLYVYGTNKEFAESFINNISQMGKDSVSTRLFYLHNTYKKNEVYINNSEAVSFNEILNRTNADKALEVFKKYYELKEVPPTKEEYQWADGIYEEDTLTVILNDLNPHKIVKLNKYVRTTHRKCLVCCYDEQSELIHNIFKQNENVYNHLLIATLPRNNVMQFLQGKTHSLD